MGRNLKQMLALALLALLAGCAEQKPAFELSSRWFKVTEVNGERVLLNPCDAANIEIQLNPDRTELLVMWGQEEEVYPLMKTETMADGYTLQAEVVPGSATAITATLVDAGNRLVRWTWADANSQHDLLMTDSLGLTHLKTVEQPCSECWGEEECAQREATAQLVGIWQNAPAMAAGWADTYQFFANGEFTFNYSQMVCDKRTLSFSGQWSVDETGALVLTIYSQTVVEGGQLVPATGSCSSEYEIEGGEVKTVELNETRTLQRSAISTDAANMGRKAITLEGATFWQMNDDPSKYE